jgi:hypothetical protein
MANENLDEPLLPGAYVNVAFSAQILINHHARTLDDADAKLDHSCYLHSCLGSDLGRVSNRRPTTLLQDKNR